MPDLGEQAINKVAEMGIASQLDEVENLDVQIETDPLKLVSGAVDSVEIKGEGLVMQQDLRIEEMQIHTGSVSINPFSAAFGKIELNHPTDAEAYVMLTEADINRAFNSDFIRDKMQNLDVHVNGEFVTVDTQQIEFGLPEENKISLGTNVILQGTQETKRVAFTAVPKVSPDGQQITLEEVEYLEGQDLSPELTNALLAQARELLNLRNFELEGMSLTVRKLDVQPGKLILHSEAYVEQFPSS
jgi:LmeA-like phospholipid-binding